MKTYEEFKKLCLSKRGSIPEDYKKFFDKELKYAERFYTNGRNLYEELMVKKPKVASPLMYALGLCDEIKDFNLEMIQVRNGASGGV